MADDSGIDPRHPAQFQRGYDPASHPDAAIPDAGARPPSPVRLAGGPVTTAERVELRPRRPEVAVAVEPEVAAEQDEIEPAPAVVRWEEWALLGLAAALVLAAAGLVQLTVAAQTGQFSAEDASAYAWMQIRSELPGPLAVGAAFAFVAWCVLRGVRKAQP
jgi:hypothetical protein